MKRKEELNKVGIQPKGNVYFNLGIGELVKTAVELGEGSLTDTGALLVTTGKYTGRSPNDRYVVQENPSSDSIAWGKVNVPMSKETFNALHQQIAAYLSDQKQLFVFDGYAGADRNHSLNIRVINELASQNLFIHQLLRRLDESELALFKEDFTLLVAPGCKADPQKHGINSEAFIVISMEEKMVLVGGSKYSGEMKKSVFSLMNYLLPHRDILPMHCSANKGEKDTALFFGLSGTGKTTLSADVNRRLIGDDEHGWSQDGIFNFEGGCYAKCINLTRESEPQIFDAIKFGALVENVIVDTASGNLDFFNTSLTQNTRTGYPLSSISNSDKSGIGKHPKTVVFLTADAFGVLPPISKLDTERAMYHFMSGYTSKLAGTERGVTEPQATFSSFFGEPFMPLEPMVYANLLAKRIGEHKTNVFLVNTGWTGGPYGIGKRMRLAYTRAMVTAALNGELDDVEYEFDPIFKLSIPVECPGVPKEVLRPEDTWSDNKAYLQTANKLAAMFQKNFERFGDIPASIAESGPAPIEDK